MNLGRDLEWVNRTWANVDRPRTQEIRIQDPTSPRSSVVYSVNPSRRASKHLTMSSGEISVAGLGVNSNAHKVT